jgi:metallo-beta-lactamase family protein
VSIQLTSYGGVGEVTGSKHLLELSGKKILIDCGLFQGEREQDKKNLTLAFRPQEVDAVLLTHAHMDHCGMIPYLVKMGFKGPIYCTKPTKELAMPLWEDSINIFKHRGDSLYNLGDAKRANRMMKVVRYGEKIDMGDVHSIFHPNAHILGSASVQVMGQGKTILFSGDLGRADAFIHPPLKTRAQADVVVMETTYGNKLHQEWQQEKLIQLIQKCQSQSSTLLIAAFAIDRTQIILHLLNQLFENRPELSIPVWLSGRLALKANQIYLQHRKELSIASKDFKKSIKLAKDLQWAKQKKNFYHKHAGAKIILAASGMLAGGTIHYHLKNLIHDPKSTLLLTGYQAQGTPGKRLLAGEKVFPFEDKESSVEIAVEQLHGLSSHPDQKQLDDWLALNSRPHKLLLCHGDPEASEQYQAHISEQGYDCNILKYGEKVQLF